jgi:hypothetical protein
MANLCKYRVYCETDSQHEITGWLESAPTECPVNGSHTITASKTASIDCRPVTPVVYDPVMEPVVPGASKVVANDRPAIEIQDDVTGFAAIQTTWPCEQNAEAKIRATLAFILKAAGTGTQVRIAFKAKAESTGEDTSEAFTESGFVVVTVSHTTLGESFEGSVELDASSFNLNDAMALQIGRDGNNEMGAGANDDVDVAIQIIDVRVEAY